VRDAFTVSRVYLKISQHDLNYGAAKMKVWIILIIILMSLGVSITVARLSEKIWGKKIRFAVFVMVLSIIWIFFWLGTL
jgi:hypothetical protein